MGFIINLFIGLILGIFNLFLAIVVKTGLFFPIATYFIADHFGVKGYPMLWLIVGSVVLTVAYDVHKLFERKGKE